jgi:hypothetical protein
MTTLRLAVDNPEAAWEWRGGYLRPSDLGARIMQRINVYKVYEFAVGIRPLAGIRQETMGDAYFTCMIVEGAIDTFLKERTFDFPLVRKAARDLKTKLNEFTTEHYANKDQAKRDEENDKKVGWKGHEIREAFDAFEHVFAAEVEASAIYAVPKRGIYETASLVETAFNHFPEDLLPFVNDMAKAEFAAAGRCIAFDLPTAAGFHALRACEAVLDDYYKTFAGANAPECKSWKDYHDKLDELIKKKATPCPNEKTIRNIDQLRDLDRNPVMHPRDTLDMTAALVLFNNCASAMMSMASEMRVIKGAAGQGNLRLISGPTTL